MKTILASETMDIPEEVTVKVAAKVVTVARVASSHVQNLITAAGKGKEVLSGVVFQPFEEIKGELSLVPQTPDKSLARQKFVDECEAAINEQIK
jgi:ferritin heavy chain